VFAEQNSIISELGLKIPIQNIINDKCYMKANFLSNRVM